MTSLKRLRELDEQASEAPWARPTPFTIEDAELIAEMRNMLPALLDIAEAAKKMDDAWDRFCDDDLDDFDGAALAIGELRASLSRLEATDD